MKCINIFFFLFLSCFCFSQQNPCGTVIGKSDWLKNYQKDPSKYDKRNGDILWVPMAVTLVGTSEGLDIMSTPDLLEALCTLNSDFEDSEIQFYLAKPIKYLLSTKYANHSSVLEGAELMFANNEPNMINTYFMENAAGNCGYNLPYAGIAMSINCAQPGDHTWAHEVGHNLSLPHPFLGWEGGVSHDGSVSHDYGTPAPEMITYDYTYFQDTLILDTMIIDTAYVEKMDGSNCHYAADGFCDTAPDYLGIRWNCNNDDESNTVQTDPNGVEFKSDGTLLMSYSNSCRGGFSDEQSDAMRANLVDEKSSYLGNEVFIENSLDENVEVITPEYLEEVYYKDVYLEWEPVDNATLYLVQVTRLASFNASVFDTVISSNSIVLPEMKFQNHKHYFRVKALNEYNFCNDYVATGGFTTSDIQTNVDDELFSNVIIEPSLLLSGQALNIKNGDVRDLDISISDLSGREVFNSSFKSDNLYIPTYGWSSGVYVVRLVIDNVSVTKKIAITN